MKPVERSLSIVALALLSCSRTPLDPEAVPEANPGTAGRHSHHARGLQSTAPDGGAANRCGNGRLDDGEVCDDGANNGSYGACSIDCAGRADRCGDGRVTDEEVCDDGVNDGSYGGCEPGCGRFAGYCGDGVVDGPESCDDGAPDDGQGCTPDCLGVARGNVCDANGCACVVFVNGSAVSSGDGLSWDGAESDLQIGLALAAKRRAACSRVEVWITVETYSPGNSTGDSFRPADGVSLIGGFVGTETRATDRVVKSHATVLDGLIAGTTAVSHVVDVENATVRLDGLTVQNGNAPGDPDPGVDCGGGGIFIRDSDVVLSQVTVHDNQACEGAGLWAYQADVVVDRVDVFENTARDSGGGINAIQGTLNGVDLRVEGNFATTGFGGGVNTVGVTGTLDRVRVVGNHSGFLGGGLALGYGPLHLSNVLIAHNQSRGRGAAVHTDDDGHVFVNCTVFDNVPGSGNDPFSTYLNKNIELHNCLVFGAPNADAVLSLPDDALVYDSCIEGHGADSRNNVDCTQAGLPFVDEDGHLGPNSAFRDVGDAAALEALTRDLDGNPRVVGGGVDLGAYELQ